VADSDAVEGNTMCSVSYFQFSKIEGLTHVHGATHDAPKEAIVAQLLEKKILQLFPSLEANIPADATIATTLHNISLMTNFDA
jgi:hypothetical protein